MDDDALGDQIEHFKRKINTYDSTCISRHWFEIINIADFSVVFDCNELEPNKSIGIQLFQAPSLCFCHLVISEEN